MMNDHVTCICITYERIDLLKQAISYFQHQTHDKKDLMILFQSNDKMTKEYIQENESYQSGKIFFHSEPFQYKLELERKTDSNVLFIEVPNDQKISLGSKRNIGVELAKGEYVCMWDDDDWYPNYRIEHQLNFIKFSQKKACTLASIYLHNKATNQFYLTGLRPEGWEGTLLCKKQVMGKYEDLNKNEDTPVIHFLQENNDLCIMEEPELYVYNAHQNNVSGNSHFELIVKYAKPAVEEDLPAYFESLNRFSRN